LPKKRKRNNEIADILGIKGYGFSFSYIFNEGKFIFIQGQACSTLCK
jgi:hypothetical protein